MENFKDLVWDNLVEVALAQVFATFPFLNFWPINVAIRYICMQLSDSLYIAVDQFIDTKMIPIRNEALKKEIGRSEVKLKIVANNHGIESEEFKNARTENKDHLRKFLRTGAA